MGRQVGTHGCDRDIAVQIDCSIGAGCGGDMLVTAFDPQIGPPGWRQLWLGSERGAGAETLCGDTGAFDLGGWNRREVDVVEQTVVLIGLNTGFDDAGD